MESLPLKCSIQVVAGVVPNEPIPEYTREWGFDSKDLEDKWLYIDKSGAAMNYAMSLQNPQKVNWVMMNWIWY